MPMAAGSPKWTGVPCAAETAQQTLRRRIACAGVIGRIDTTIGP